MKEIEYQDPYSMFLFAMRSPKTREKCTGQLRMFFDFVGILPEDTMINRSKAFCEKSNSDKWMGIWLHSTYLQQLKERVEAKEITAGTMKNRYQAVKLFCEMVDIPMHWKKISRGIPKVRKFADDRAPTIEEIQKITEYPDRSVTLPFVVSHGPCVTFQNCECCHGGFFRHAQCLNDTMAIGPLDLHKVQHLFDLKTLRSGSCAISTRCISGTQQAGNTMTVTKMSSLQCIIDSHIMLLGGSVLQPRVSSNQSNILWFERAGAPH